MVFSQDEADLDLVAHNFYADPQEIEATLITHPLVADVAVVGAPDPEMGERVVAVVQPLDWTNAGAKLSEELKSWLRERISHVKVPREISFSKELPRHDTGKIYKRFLKVG